MFASQIGKPISATNLTKFEFRALLEHAGLPPIRFHDPRHSHATLLLSHGVSVRVVQERLGHADVQTTLSTYGHVLPTAQQAAIAQVSAALREAIRQDLRQDGKVWQHRPRRSAMNKP
ncbi:site-specific integrase [bacterium]|nr:MAG: site-specific integrase [bacterium]